MTEEFLRQKLVKEQIEIRVLANELGVPVWKISQLVRLYNLSKDIKEERLKSQVGKRYGKLVIESYNCHKNGHIKWSCKCDCGNTVVCFQFSLRNGDSNSCGCVTVARMRATQFKGYEGLGKTYYSRLIRQAASRNLAFTVSMEYLWDLYIQQNGKCKLSGLDIQLSEEVGRRYKKHTASLDRIDNNKGYIEGNVQWLHKDVNRMKLNHSEKYFIELCSSIADTFKNVQP